MLSESLMRSSTTLAPASALLCLSGTVSANPRRFFPTQHLVEKVGAGQEFLGSKNQNLSRQDTPGRKNFDFCLTMAGNLLILAHFGEEFIHIGKNLSILARRDSPRQENFQHFPHQPLPDEEQILDFPRLGYAPPQTSPPCLGLLGTQKIV